MQFGLESAPDQTPRRKKAPEKRPDSDYEEYWQALENKDYEDYMSYWRPEARKAYLEQGAEFVVDIHEKKPDTIVFLDKSARPLAGFFRAIWRRLYENESPPEMRFMTGMQFYAEEPGKYAHKAAESLDADVLNGKTVLVVDEFISSGKTVRMAGDMLKTAFPKIQKMLYGGMSGHGGRPGDVELDIYPPKGSENQGRLEELGTNIYSKSGIEVQEVPGEVLTRAARKVPASETWTAKLRMLGKGETLDAASIDGLQERVQNDGKERIALIRAAYEKLMPKG